MRTKASRDATLRLVGELYYLRGMGLKDVAAVIGQSTATVSRMLQQARDRGIVRIEVVPADTDTAGLATDLSDALDVECLILPAHGTDAVSSSRSLGAEAAEIVAARLPQRGVVGLAAGHTLHALVGSLPRQDRHELQLVPAIGGYHPVHPHLDTNALSREAAKRLNCLARSVLAPASVESAEAREVLLSDPVIREATALWDEVDTTVYSTSAPAEVVQPGFSVMETIRNRTREELIAHGMVGDIFGHLYDITGDLEQDRWNGMLISMSIEQVRRGRERIALIAGVDKAKSALGMARTRVPSLLIMDASAALGVRDLLEADASAR
ncbi:MAG: hypothetical protein J0H23_14265 [Micrococcales bacterium]|nr:hypothetical protein [Micrococcales bacterium]OJX68950.1 MAG: hypothetical protein BGO94_10160 [Micrococcales bacterium 72-143]